MVNANLKSLIILCVALISLNSAFVYSAPQETDDSSVSNTEKVNKRNNANKTSDPNSVILVYGVPIDKSKFEQVLSERLGRGVQDSPQLRGSIAQELVNRELLLREAKKIGIDRKLSVKTQISLASDQIIVNRYVDEFFASNPISEDALKKEYQDIIKRAGTQEVLLRQILVSSSEEAKGVLARLNSGEKFEDLAVKVSRDGSSSQQGGLLAWTPVGFLQPKISDSIKSLSKGSLTKDAVQTPYGWHIIRLEDTRNYVKPEFTQIKSQILLGLQQKLLDEFLRKLASKSSK